MFPSTFPVKACDQSDSRIRANLTLFFFYWEWFWRSLINRGQTVPEGLSFTLLVTENWVKVKPLAGCRGIWCVTSNSSSSSSSRPAVASVPRWVRSSWHQPSNSPTARPRRAPCVFYPDGGKQNSSDWWWEQTGRDRCFDEADIDRVVSHGTLCHSFPMSTFFVLFFQMSNVSCLAGSARRSCCCIFLCTYLLMHFFLLCWIHSFF